MRGSFEQFYRTWCYAGRSVSGADGWKIRAKSAGLPLPEAEGMADLANYWVPTRINAQTPPGARLALYRPSATQSVLAHGVLRPGLVGGRAGVSFEHVITRLPPAFSAFEAIRLWHSPAWKLDDGEFNATLGPFLWEEQIRGSEFRNDDASGAGTMPPDAASAWEDTLAGRFVAQYPGLPWAHTLQACLALSQRSIERLFIAGQDEVIARLLYVVFYCLPEAFRDQLTFSTHENPKGTKGVRIVGVTTFEGEELDLPPYCYEGQYRALNLFSGARSEAIELGPFAAAAIDWLHCGQYAYVREVLARFNDLDAADDPGARELDLLSQGPNRGEDSANNPESELELCASRAIAHARVIRASELSKLLACVEANPEFEIALARQLSAWLPANGPATAQFAAALAELAYEELSQETTGERWQQASRFAQSVAPGLPDQVQDRLLQLCLAAPADRTPPSMGIRLRLLETWVSRPAAANQPPPTDPSAALNTIAARWLEGNPPDLLQVLHSRLPAPFKLRAIRSCFEMRGAFEVAAAEAIGAAIGADAALNREVFFELPRWRKAPGTIASALPESVLSRVVEVCNQSLALVDALRDDGSRLIETIELWQGQFPDLVPERLRSIHKLGRYLRQPWTVATLEGELVSRAFWWNEGGKEEAVNVALDRLLSVCSLEDFERALGWFGHGAWARAPVDFIALADQRLAKRGASFQTADPVLQEILGALVRVLKEWEQSRHAPLGTASAREGKIDFAPGATAIAALGRIALGCFPGESLLKSPTGRELLGLLKKENHLLDAGQKDRFQTLYGVYEACAAKEPQPDTLLALAQSRLETPLDAGLREEVVKFLQAEVAKHAKLLRPFLRKFFDSRPELFTRQFLPGFMDWLADREVKLKENPLTEEFAQAIRDLGNDLPGSDPAFAENLKRFLKRLPPKSRERFEHTLRQPDLTRANPLKLHPLDASQLKPLKPSSPNAQHRARRIFLALTSEAALHIYFYALVMAGGALAVIFWRNIAEFFKQAYQLH